MPREVHECPADFHSTNVESALGELNREKSGTWSNLEYRAARWDECRDTRSERLELRHVLAGGAVVPARDAALHPHSLVSFRHGNHGIPPIYILLNKIPLN